MHSASRVPVVSVALVVAGGVIWMLAGVLYGAEVVSCFSCPSVVVAPGISAESYPADAIRNLAWDALYANLYVVTIGFLATVIGLTAFRQGDRWAWYALAGFALAGLLTALLDYLAWGGWYTFLALGLLPLLGVLLSVRSFFPGRGAAKAGGIGS